MEIKFGEQIIQSYKRLSYKEWYALAEFVDNSTGAYLKNKEVLDKSYDSNETSLIVDIDYSDEQIIISDNSIGMSREELEGALVVGQKPDDPTGRSRYGLGLKTAACWLGNHWTVETKKIGETSSFKITVDVEKIASGDLDLDDKEKKDLDPEEHYTIITITQLNRQFANRTKGRVKNFLRSIYRKDFEYGLKLIWMGDELKWDFETMIGKRLHQLKDGSKMIKEFQFLVNNKEVSGWVGVYEKGSRKNAGFSIIQNNRVIEGWPDAYLPYSIYGERRNDLINQRIVGELYLNSFDVSHTKDQILFLGDESSELEFLLKKECIEFMEFAQNYRKYQSDEEASDSSNTTGALNEFEKEINSTFLRDSLEEIIPEEELLDHSYENIIDAVTKRVKPNLKTNLEGAQILIYVDDGLSVNDPYVAIESTKSKTRVIIIINANHPHWSQLNNKEGILNFIRHCVYDGLSEWKAYFRHGNLQPNTVKWIKDRLLRVRMEMESSD